MIMAKIASVIALLIALGFSPVRCVKPGIRKCAEDEKCPPNKPFKTVTIETDSTYRYIKTSACPPYNNPNWTNPGFACIDEVSYKVPLQPKLAKKPIPMAEAISPLYKGMRYLKESPTPILGAVGVLINGVNVFGVGSPCVSVPCEKDGAPSDMVDAVDSEGHTVDYCGGHPSPNGEYHVHSGIGIKNNSQRAACNLPQDQAGNHSQLLGWMFDGFGLYGINSLGGVLPDDLDKCGGHTHKVNGTDTYHYHLPDNKFPWTIGCYKGCPEVSNNPSKLKVASDEEYGCGGVTGDCGGNWACFQVVLSMLLALGGLL